MLTPTLRHYESKRVAALLRAINDRPEPPEVLLTRVDVRVSALLQKMRQQAEVR